MAEKPDINTQQPTKLKDFFISYNKADRAWAKWIAGVLEENGRSVYLQAWDIRPGEDFIAQMSKFLELSNGFIPVMSGNYKDSDYCEIELSAGLNKWIDRNKRTENPPYRFIPVRVADIKPPDIIQTIVHISIFGISEEEAEKELLHAVDPNPPPRKRPAFPGKTRSAFPGSAIHCTTNLPPRNAEFTGRLTKLQDIVDAFALESRLIVKGPGGYGKTQLAVEYAYLHKTEYDYIWIVNAESAMKLEADYREFVLRVGVPVADKDDPAAVLFGIKRWMQEHDRYLFIFENAEGFTGEEKQSLQSFLPESELQGHILINSRDKLHLPYTQIDVDLFSLDESVEFLTKYDEGINKDDARELSRQLGRLPLALEHAVAYMKSMDGSTPSEYLKLLQKNGLELLAEEVSDRDSQKTVAVTWLVSIKKIKSESARQLFDLCAYCAPDDIPLELFIQGRGKLLPPLREELAEKLKSDRLLRELSDYSLLSFRRDSAGHYFLSMHRLMQLVVRNQHDDTQWLAYCLAMARSVFDCEYGNRESMNAFGQSVAHVLAIADHAGTAFPDDDAKQTIIARIYHDAGRGFYYSANYTQALEWNEKALAICEKVLGKEHPSTADTYNNIAGVYHSQGDYPKALEWYEKDLAISEKVLGKEHPSTATTYNNIALVYSHQGDYPKALELYKKALAIREKVLGKEHPNTADTYDSIAGVYSHQGDSPQALEWYEKALAIREKVLGKEHPDTAGTYNNIAGVYDSQGDYPKALEWFEKALAIFEKALGKEHPNTATTYNNIAVVYRNQGDYPKALEWYEKALAIREKVLGKEHPDTATTYNNIAGVYYSQGDYPKALEWYEKALAIYEKVLGKEHPDTSATYNNIALVYDSQGDYLKALEWREKASAIRKKVLGKEHPETSLQD